MKVYGFKRDIVFTLDKKFQKKLKEGKKVLIKGTSLSGEADIDVKITPKKGGFDVTAMMDGSCDSEFGYCKSIEDVENLLYEIYCTSLIAG